MSCIFSHTDILKFLSEGKEKMALRGLVKRTEGIKSTNSVVNLYRSVIQELPRVMAIYDVDMPVKQARKAVKFHFEKHAALQDERVIGLLISKGYMELEETLKQWKQKTHLLRLLDPIELQEGSPKAPEKIISEDKVPKELADAINDSDPIRFAKFFSTCNEEDALKWMVIIHSFYFLFKLDVRVKPFRSAASGGPQAPCGKQAMREEQEDALRHLRTH